MTTAPCSEMFGISCYIVKFVIGKLNKKLFGAEQFDELLPKEICRSPISKAVSERHRQVRNAFSFRIF